MSEYIAVEEREFMPKLLDAARQDIAFYFNNLKLIFTRRLVFAEARLQTEGARGEDIVTFQKRFNVFSERYGILAPVSGIYDAETRSAVADFQHAAMYVLDSDGFVGPDTARVLHIKLLEN